MIQKSYQQTRSKASHAQQNSVRTKGHETFLLFPFFKNLRFNISSIFKKDPVDLLELKTNHPKLYSTVQKTAEEYGTDEKTVITSFLNLKLQKPEENRQR